MPSSAEKRSHHRDSWPPTQVYLKPTVSTKDTPLPELDDIDSDPLTYFLTPTPGLEDDEVDDAAMLDFDAGIEGAGQPRDIARSVSPSTLDGLRKPGLLRPTSPDDACSDATMSDGADYYYDCDTNDYGFAYGDDDDEEDYIRFSPGRDGLLGLRDDTFLSAAAAAGPEHLRPRSPALGFSRSPTRPTAALGTAGAGPAALLLAPGSPQLRGRTRGRGHGGAGVVPAARSVSARRRPGQLWREPSPDVWSIEEETEEQLVRSGAGSPLGSSSGGGGGTGKPKKRVRFVLPTRAR